MTMPSMVSRKRALLARKLSMARLTVSRKEMVERALRRVFSKLEEALFRSRAASLVSFAELMMLVDMGYAYIPALFQYRSLRAAGATLSVWNIGCYGVGFELRKNVPEPQPLLCSLPLLFLLSFPAGMTTRKAKAKHSRTLPASVPIL